MRHSLAAASLVAALTLTPGVATPAWASPADSDGETEGTAALSRTGQRAFAELAGCAAGADALLVDVIVDESGSLRSTDPAGVRVPGVLTAVDALQTLAEQSGDELDVQVGMSTFAEGYEVLVPVAALDADHADRLRGAAVDELPSRQFGQSTDYRQALRGAQQTLDEAAADSGANCRVALWFTDGGLDVGDDTAAALDDLCQPLGLVDGVRSGGMTVVSLALFTESGQGSVTAEQRDQLRAVVEGQGEAGTSCGATPIPSDAAAGAYLRADDAGSLRRLFAGAGALIAGGTGAGSVSCPGEECSDGSTTVVVDPGVAGARLVVEGPDVATVTLRGPSGQELLGTDESVEFAGGNATFVRRDGLVVASLTFDSPDGSQVGEWSVTSVDTDGDIAASDSDLYYFWGAELLVSSPGLVVGEGGQALVRLTAGGGVLVPDLYRSVDVTVTVDGERLPLEETADGFVAEIALPADASESVLAVGAEASATTRSGVALGPVAGQAQLPTSLPPSFASVSPSRLDLPGLVGVDSVTRPLSVTGSEQGSSTVCARAGEILGPPQAEGLAVLVPGCVEVPAGETIELPVQVLTAAGADGLVSGSVVLTLSDTEGGADHELTVPLGLTMTRPVDEPLRWGLVALLTLLALVVPLVLLYVGNALVARFAVGSSSRVAMVPVVLSPTGVSRADGGPVLRPDDFQWFTEGGRGTTTGFSAGGATWRRHLPLWPLAEPTASVHAGDAPVVLSNVGAYSTSEGRQAPSDFGLATTWVLLVDPASVDTGRAEASFVCMNDDAQGLRQIIEARTRQLREFPGWQSTWDRLQAAREIRETRAEQRVASQATAPFSGAGDEDRPPAFVVSPTAGEPGRRPENPFSRGAGQNAGPPPSTLGRRADPPSPPPPAPGSQRRSRPSPEETPTGPFDDRPPSPFR